MSAKRSAPGFPKHPLHKALGLTGKPEGVDGGQVEAMVLAGQIEEVSRYCESDVLEHVPCVARLRVDLESVCDGPPLQPDHAAAQSLIYDLSIKTGRPPFSSISSRTYAAESFSFLAGDLTPKVWVRPPRPAAAVLFSYFQSSLSR